MSRIVIADDHAILRDGLRTLIERDRSFAVVGEAGDARDAARLAGELRPNILVIDLNMPGGNTVHAIQEILSHSPAIRIIVLTMHDDPAFLRAALASGAVGYVLKRSAHATLLDALRSVRDGRMFVDPAFPVDASATAQPAAPVTALSSREREVLVLLARGLTYREAGAQLHVGARTIETHRRHIAEKLGLRTRADLLRYALEVGLVAPGAPSPL